MSEIQQASKDAIEAAQQGEQFALLLAALQQAKQQSPACQHPAPAPVVKSSGGAAKWVGIALATVFVAIAIAVSLVSLAICVVCLTVCALILRDVWKSIQNKG